MRIAIVNDSIMAVEALKRVLATSPDHQLAWVAQDGAQAVQCCVRNTPDLILMDLLMPVMDGVEATRRIMAQSPCAILIVTATVDGHIAKTFEALGAGALDAVSTPVLGTNGAAEGAAALLAKIGILGRLVGSANGPGRLPQTHRTESQTDAMQRERLVVIGASAGGPAALATVLSGLPHDFSAAIVIIQHVDTQFAPLMAKWLDDQSPLLVRTAREGDQPQAGTALVAATNDHLVFANAQTLTYTPEPLASSYRPSVDAFFESVVRYRKGQVVGVLLTGMGRDGAKGLKALRQAGAVTIAQDQASCVVYGMPKAAAELDAATEILPLDSIASRLRNFFMEKRVR